MSSYKMAGLSSALPVLPFAVNTMPPTTLDAFRDHGRVKCTVTESVDEAQAALVRLAELGIDLQAIAETLQKDGMAAFASDYEHVLAGLERKKHAILAQPVRAGS